MANSVFEKAITIIFSYDCLSARREQHKSVGQTRPDIVGGLIYLNTAAKAFCCAEKRTRAHCPPYTDEARTQNGQPDTDNRQQTTEWR